ncbi:MAG: TIGR02206 family membrane protein [Candidatus Latescibacteria bacterium]|nr:TIGR02206 family membrane protein [Candidatus Latescibacterota bacterium]
MELFSVHHLAWLGVAALFVAGCIYMRRWPVDSRWHRTFRAALFILLLLSESSWALYRHFGAQVPLVKNLPLHLCDLSVFSLLLGLATGRRLFAELSYYAGGVGALLALCQPSISETGAIRVVAEFRYFLTHIILVGGGFYLTFGRRYRPGAGAILRSYLAILLYALLVTPLNLALGSNYFYTLAAPRQLDWLQHYPHALFLGVVALIFLGVFTLMHLLFTGLGRRSDRI